MAFFDELSRTLSDKGKEAAQKAKEAAGVLQLKAQIASEKSKLKELYGAVGVLYYKKHRDDEDNEFQDLFREIGNVLTNVAAMEANLQEMDGTIICPSCKKPMKKGSSFCSRCGAALKTETEDDDWDEDGEKAGQEPETGEVTVTEDQDIFEEDELTEEQELTEE